MDLIKNDFILVSGDVVSNMVLSDTLAEHKARMKKKVRASAVWCDGLAAVNRAGTIKASRRSHGERDGDEFVMRPCDCLPRIDVVLRANPPPPHR